MVVPAASSSRTARMALLRASSWRRLAAAISCAVLSARIGGPRPVGVCRGLERGDDLVEVAEHVPVHLGQPLLAAGFGGGEDLDDLLALLVVLGQELRGGDEHRAGQAPLTDLISTFGHVTR